MLMDGVTISSFPNNNMPHHPTKLFTPLHHLPTPPAHQKPSTRNVTTLHGSNQGYTNVDGSIRLFVNLEVLWLDKNELNEKAIGELVPAAGQENSSNFQETSTSFLSTTAENNNNATTGSRLNATTSTTFSVHDAASPSETSEKMQSSSRRRRAPIEPLQSQNHAKGTTRLKELYLQYNKITKIPFHLTQMKFLKVLLLHHNRLRDLDTQLQILKQFRFLEHLDLFENPLAEELLYRERVLTDMTDALRILDRHVIEDTERLEARKKVRRWKRKGAASAVTSSTATKTKIRTTAGTASAKLNTTRKQKKPSTKVVFGKSMRPHEMKPSLPPADEYSPSVRQLYRECMEAKERINQKTYHFHQNLTEEDLLKNSLRYGDSVATSRKTPSDSLGQQSSQKFIEEHSTLAISTLSQEQRDAIKDFTTVSSEKIHSLFPSAFEATQAESRQLFGLQTSKPLTESQFDTFFLQLCKSEAEKHFQQLKDAREKQPLKLEDAPKEPEEEVPDKKKGKGKAASKKKDSKKGAPEPEQDEEEANLAEQCKQLAAAGTAWESLRLEFERYMKQKRKQQKLAKQRAQRSNAKRSDLFSGHHI